VSVLCVAEEGCVTGNQRSGFALDGADRRIRVLMEHRSKAGSSLGHRVDLTLSSNVAIVASNPRSEQNGPIL
jgi:hypothetical protein